MTDRWIVSILIASEENESEGLRIERLLRDGEDTDIDTKPLASYLINLLDYLSRQDKVTRKAFLNEFPHTIDFVQKALNNLDVTSTEEASRLVESMIKFLSGIPDETLNVSILLSLSSLTHYCTSESSLQMLMTMMEQQLADRFHEFLDIMIDDRVHTACDVLVEKKRATPAMLMSLVSQDVVLLHLLPRLRAPDRLDCFLEPASLNELVSGCLSLRTLIAKETAMSRRAAENDIQERLGPKAAHDDLERLLLCSIILCRCIKLRANLQMQQLSWWWLSSLMTGAISLGSQQIDSDQIFLLGELSRRLIDILDTTPESLRNQGFDNFVEKVQLFHQNAVPNEYSVFASIWNMPEESSKGTSNKIERHEQEVVPEATETMDPISSVLYNPKVTAEERNYISILKALVDPSGPTVGEGYLLIALRVASSIYEDQDMNNIIEQLAADPLQCEVFFPTDLLVIKPMTSLEIAIGMLQNLSLIRSEKAKDKKVDYSGLDQVGRSWEVRNKTMQLVRQQQQEEQEEELAEDAGAFDPTEKASAVDFLTTTDSTAYSTTPWNAPGGRMQESSNTRAPLTQDTRESRTLSTRAPTAEESFPPVARAHPRAGQDASDLSPPSTPRQWGPDRGRGGNRSYRGRSSEGGAGLGRGSSRGRPRRGRGRGRGRGKRDNIILW